MEVGIRQDSQLWNALSHPTRRQILQLLREKPLTTGTICEQFKVSRYAIMKHLTVLEEAGLIQVHREGRHRWNALEQDMLARLEAGPGQVLSWPGYQDEADGLLDGSEPNPLAAQAGTAVLTEKLRLAVTVERAYGALTEEIDRWWVHRRLTSSSRMVMEAWLNGRFYEATEDQGGFLYGVVSGLRPGQVLWLDGPIFDAQRPLASQVRIELVAERAETLIKVRHDLTFLPDSATTTQYAACWQEALGSLKDYVEGAD